MEFVRRLEKENNLMARYVPGNHDLWNVYHQEESVDDIYRHFCEDERCLCGKEEILGDYVLIGDVGWYDYSYGSDKYSAEEYGRMEKNGRVWQDSIRNTWTKDNKGRTDFFVERLRDRLRQYPQQRKILVTHMISHPSFKVPENLRDWDYFNGFLGSEKLCQLCREFQVEYAICGHVHYRKSFLENGTRWMCRCLNYEYEWDQKDTLRRQIREAAEILYL